MCSIDFKLGGYSVHIPLTELNNILLGNGNVGKTCLFKQLCAAVNKKEVAGKFLFIDIASMYNIKLIENIADDCLVVIDNFDAVRVRCPEIIDYLLKYKPQTLIFGRDVFDLPCNKHYVYFVSCNDIKKCIELRPLIPYYMD